MADHSRALLARPAAQRHGDRRSRQLDGQLCRRYRLPHHEGTTEKHLNSINSLILSRFSLIYLLTSILCFRHYWKTIHSCLLAYSLQFFGYLLTKKFLKRKTRPLRKFWLYFGILMAGKDTKEPFKKYRLLLFNVITVSPLMDGDTASILLSHVSNCTSDIQHLLSNHKSLARVARFYICNSVTL